VHTVDVRTGLRSSGMASRADVLGDRATRRRQPLEFAVPDAGTRKNELGEAA